MVVELVVLVVVVDVVVFVDVIDVRGNGNFVAVAVSTTLEVFSSVICISYWFICCCR